MRASVSAVLVLAVAGSAAAATPGAEDLPEGYDYTRGLLSVTVSKSIRIPLDKEELVAWLRTVQQKVAAACAKPTNLALTLTPAGAAGPKLLKQADRRKLGIVVAVSLDRFQMLDRYSGTRYRERYGTLRWQFNHAVMYRTKRRWVPLVQGPLPGPTEASIYSGRLYRFEVEGNPIVPSLSRALLPCRPASGSPAKARVRNNRPVPVVVYALGRDRPSPSPYATRMMRSTRRADPVTVKPFEEAEVPSVYSGKVMVSLAGLEGEKAPSSPTGPDR